VHEARLCHRQGLLERLIGRLGSTEQHVRPHRVGEQGRVLERHRDVPAKIPQAQVADVDPVDQDRAARHLVEARRERGERRLARAGQPHQRHRLAGLEHQVDAGEEVGRVGRRVRVGEAHAAELESAARLLEGLRMLRVGDQHRLVQHLEEPVDRVAGVHGEGQQEADRLEGEPQHRRRGEERDEGARGQVAAGGEEDPEDQADGEGAVRQEAQPAPDERDRARLLHLGAAELLRLPLELLQGVRPAAERLEHADAVHRLLDRRGQVAGLVLAAPGGARVGALEVHRDQPDGHGAREEHEPEQWGDPDEQDRADDDGDQVHDEQHHAEGQPAADQADVVHRTGEQLPARPAVVEGDRQGLQVRIERAAHPRLNVGIGREDQPAPGEDRDRLEEAEADDDEGGGQHGARIALGERGVDEDLEHLRDGERDEARHHADGDAADEARQGGPDVRQEPRHGVWDRLPARGAGECGHACS
jgi:hypothetical protein